MNLNLNFKTIDEYYEYLNDSRYINMKDVTTELPIKFLQLSKFIESVVFNLPKNKFGDLIVNFNDKSINNLHKISKVSEIILKILLKLNNVNFLRSKNGSNSVYHNSINFFENKSIQTEQIPLELFGENKLLLKNEETQSIKESIQNENDLEGDDSKIIMPRLKHIPRLNKIVVLLQLN